MRTRWCNYFSNTTRSECATECVISAAEFHHFKTFHAECQGTVLFRPSGQNSTVFANSCNVTTVFTALPLTWQDASSDDLHIDKRPRRNPAPTTKLLDTNNTARPGLTFQQKAIDESD